MNTTHFNPGISRVRKPKILYLSLNSNLLGPLPKIDPLLITALNNLDCKITKGTWGRHSENENILQKLLGRVGDIVKAFGTLSKTRYDILYIATTLDEKALFRDVLLLLSVHWFPVKKILIEHGSKTTPLILPGNILYKFLTRLVIRFSDAILLLSSEELKAWTVFEPLGRYYRVDNPFSSRMKPISRTLVRRKENNKPHPTLLFVGRLIQEKGVFDLLDALPIILKHSDCHLLIAGIGEKKDEIKHRIERANLSQFVTLPGYLDSEHLANAYRASIALILPTYLGEGFPTVIAEAMSFGLPIVTTPLRGAYDHLQDGVNTIFVQPRNPVAIANAVLRLLLDPELCAEMGHANIKKVRDFLPENIAPKYLEIFNKVLGLNNS